MSENDIPVNARTQDMLRMSDVANTRLTERRNRADSRSTCCARRLGSAKKATREGQDCCDRAPSEVLGWGTHIRPPYLTTRSAGLPQTPRNGSWPTRRRAY